METRQQGVKQGEESEKQEKTRQGREHKGSNAQGKEGEENKYLAGPYGGRGGGDEVYKLTTIPVRAPLADKGKSQTACPVLNLL